MNEVNLAWIGAFPGVKVRNVSVLIYIRKILDLSTQISKNGMFPA